MLVSSLIAKRRLSLLSLCEDVDMYFVHQVLHPKFGRLGLAEWAHCQTVRNRRLDLESVAP